MTIHSRFGLALYGRPTALPPQKGLWSRTGLPALRALLAVVCASFLLLAPAAVQQGFGEYIAESDAGWSTPATGTGQLPCAPGLDVQTVKVRATAAEHGRKPNQRHRTSWEWLDRGILSPSENERP